MQKNVLLIAGAVLIGIALRFVVSLEPSWLSAWIVPGLLLALALRADPWPARGLIALAALIGVTANVGFFLKVMPVVPVVIVMTLQALLYVFVFSGARRIVVRYQSGWTVLALPVIAVGADTLLAYFTPDGNWGSLAYTQTEFLPIAQLAALGGVPAILFVLMLVNSAIALAMTHGRKLRGALPAYGAAALVLAASLGYGYWRLNVQFHGDAFRAVSVGIASIDDFLPGPDSEQSRDVWGQYDAQVEQLAASGARFVLLPEKIDVLKSDAAEARKAQLAALAREHHVWLIAGVGVDDGKEKRNEAWWFAPDGTLRTNYLKHFMAPPEREFVSGSEYPVNPIEGIRYGVAICKDMHFARLGRGFAQRDAEVMFVPAWDFYDDAWMAAGMTKLRGIEGGYNIVRASRAGLLTISDPFGDYIAVERSAKLPGTTVLQELVVGPRIDTLYSRIGDAFGWLCVAGVVVLTFLGLRRAKP